jgi:hypothetical protein
MNRIEGFEGMVAGKVLAGASVGTGTGGGR